MSMPPLGLPESYSLTANPLYAEQLTPQRIRLNPFAQTAPFGGNIRSGEALQRCLKLGGYDLRLRAFACRSRLLCEPCLSQPEPCTELLNSRRAPQRLHCPWLTGPLGLSICQWCVQFVVSVASCVTARSSLGGRRCARAYGSLRLAIAGQ